MLPVIISMSAHVFHMYECWEVKCKQAHACDAGQRLFDLVPMSRTAIGMHGCLWILWLTAESREPCDLYH